MTPTKILLIRVGMGGQRGSDALDPVIFDLLEALTPPDFELTCRDDRVEELPSGEGFAIVAMSVETYAAARAWELARRYRAQGCVLVAGGHHVSVCPDEAARHVDTVVIGDAEDTWAALLRDHAAGRRRPVYRSDMSAPLTAVPHRTGRERGQRHRYLPLAIVETSRGCRNACEFCSIHALYGGRLRRKPLDELARELRTVRARTVFIADDNLHQDDEQFFATLDVLRQSGKRWCCQISLDILASERHLRALRESGCFLVLTGFESLNPANLKKMRKASNLQTAGSDSPEAAYCRIVERVHAHGLLIYATFILGYDHDDSASFTETGRFIEEAGFAMANFNSLMPMPGTALYRRLVAAGRLPDPEWWLDPDFRYGDVAYEPAQMTATELAAGCYRLRLDFNRLGSILRRLRTVRHAGFSARLIQLGANLISRRSILRKQGHRLSAVPADTDSRSPCASS